MNYLSVRDVARKLNMAERTVRELADKYDWFGEPLGEDTGVSGRPWVFVREEVDRMALMPRQGPGRPRKPIGDVVPAVAPPIIPVDTASP